MVNHLDPRQIRYVAGNYHQVQGLRTVAYGIVFAVGALVYALVPTAVWAISAGMWVGLGLNWVIGRYYFRTFGRVDPEGSEWGSMPYGGRLMIVVPGMVAIGFLVALGVPLYLLIALMGIVWSSGYVFYLYRSDGLRFRPYWLVACALFAAISVMILLPLSALAPLHHYSGLRWLMLVYLAPMGLVMIVCGYLDHRFLLRTLAPAQER